jgi:hypothetical protein
MSMPGFRSDALANCLLVSPRYHRWHHALDLPGGRQYRYGCNFAVLFPVWDQLFATQYRGQAMPACGIRHGPLPESAAQSGFWRQQYEGLCALAAAFRPDPCRPQPIGRTDDYRQSDTHAR